MKILVIGKYNPLDSTNPIILIKIGLLQTLSESYWEFSLKKKHSNSLTAALLINCPPRYY